MKIQFVLLCIALCLVAYTQAECQYVVQTGDYLKRIAASYQTTVQQLVDLNPIITNPDFIKPGWVLQVPCSYF